MAITGKPALAALYESTTGPTAGNTVFGNPIASMNNTLSIALPTGTDLGLAKLAAPGFEPFTIQTTADATPRTATGVLNLSGSLLIDTEPYEDMLTRLNRVLDASTPRDRDRANDELAQTVGLVRRVLETEGVPGAGWARTNDSVAVAIRGQQLELSARRVWRKSPRTDASRARSGLPARVVSSMRVHSWDRRPVRSTT